MKSSTQSHPLLSPEPKCKVCNDGKMVHPLKEDGKPDYSSFMPCLHCISSKEICRFLKISSLESTFENFKPAKGSEDALKAAKAIATLETEWKLLFINGTWGNGKTHLLEAIALTLWGKGHSVRVETFPDFMASLKGTFDRSRDSDGPSFNDLINRICNRAYLLLDDVGAAGSFSPFSLEQLERIILARYRADLFTVMTTNLDKEELPPFITSRFSDATKSRMVLNKAEDYRPKK